MTTLYVTDLNGKTHEIEAANGLSMMEILRARDFGITGACEGSMECATCHVWVDENCFDRLAEPSEDEADKLDCTVNVRITSRLSCQILVGPEIEGLRLTIPRA